MVQSLRNDVVESLDPDRYDVVIIDEVHHAAAPSYERSWSTSIPTSSSA